MKILSNETIAQVRCYYKMDDKNKVGSPDKDLINTHENYEVEYWANKFGVTSEELKNIVKQVGNSAEAVKKHLGKSIS